MHHCPHFIYVFNGIATYNYIIIAIILIIIVLICFIHTILFIFPIRVFYTAHLFLRFGGDVFIYNFFIITSVFVFIVVSIVIRTIICIVSIVAVDVLVYGFFTVHLFFHCVLKCCFNISNKSSFSVNINYILLRISCSTILRDFF